MDSYLVASIVFACVFAGSLIGLSLNLFLPEHHRSTSSHDAIKLGTGMISVLASLVLGLLVASIKTSFDTTDSQMRTFAASLTYLDQVLRNYGPEADSVRAMVRDYAARAIEDHWPQESDHPATLENKTSGAILNQAYLIMLNLKADDPYHSGLRDSALKLMDDILHTRWSLIVRAGSSIQPVFLIILVAWITVIFVSFGYNAPANATVITAFFICSLALAACLFIMVEMDTPFDGLVVISSQPMRDALAHMNQ